MTEEDPFGWKPATRVRRASSPTTFRTAEEVRTRRKAGRCIDCPATARARRTPHPGPRCATCHRTVLLARKVRGQNDKIFDGFGITSDEYWEIYRIQGGKCAWCRRATGTGRKRLAVDHDHACPAGHDPKKGCRLCVRGLLCSTCNKFIGWLRDSIPAVQRGIEYLSNPPAKAVLGVRSVDRNLVDGVHSQDDRQPAVRRYAPGGDGSFTFD